MSGRPVNYTCAKCGGVFTKGFYSTNSSGCCRKCAPHAKRPLTERFWEKVERRPRVGLSEREVRAQCRPLSSAIAQVVSGATAFSHGKSPSFDEVVDRKMAGLKFIQLPEGDADA